MKFNVNAYTKQLKGLPKQAVKQSKFAADLSADRLLDTKKVINKAEKASLSLNSIAYGTVEKLIAQQFNVVEATVEAGAKRLKTAAKAKNAKNFVQGQVKLTMDGRDRVVADVKDTVAILTNTKDDLVALFNNVYKIKSAKPAAKKTVKVKAKAAKSSTKKSAKKPAKPAAKKATKVAKKASKKASKTRAKAKTAAKRKTTRRRAA
jgi:phasin family protein